MGLQEIRSAKRMRRRIPYSNAFVWRPSKFGPPYVVKDDGLAGGKGVVVTQDRAMALAHAERCFESDHRVVVEEYLDGPEVSLFAICDGTRALPMQPAQDFKRVGDGVGSPGTELEFAL